MQDHPISVLVTGDVVTDHYIYEGRQRRPGSKIRLGTIAQATPGGAGLLHELLSSVASQQSEADLQKSRMSVSCGIEIKQIGASAVAGYCVMRPRPKQPKETDEVWRMDEPLGFSADESDLDAKAVNEQALAADHRVVVIDNAGLSFRRWPSRAAWPRFLVEASRPLPEWLVIKMSGPVASGDLWHAIVSGQTQDNEPHQVRDSAELLRRTVAVISINDLRVEPIHVSGHLSWERVALDLVNELCGSPSLTDLRRLRFVVVSLSTDGALIAEFPQEGAPKFQLIFDPARLEGDFDASIDGSLFGYQTCLTAAVVTQLAQVSNADPAAAKALEQVVCTGLCTMRRFLVEGHGPVAKSRNGSRPGFTHALLAKEIISAEHDWSYGSVKIPADQLRSPTWTIIAGGPSGAQTPALWGLARRVARDGLKRLQQTPYLQFGKLFSVERSEIESLRVLRRLLLSYQHDHKAQKPLSIAAFGPPGSGKSFGVKELAKAIVGDDVPLLEFNLSQFQDASELHGLLHQVRDQVLLGKLPVVFWDEFDARDLYWLQYLLAPMQDGAFQDGQITHPIGKCVFVFAGGTRFRFQDFGEPAWRPDLKEKKAPDFKSRLAGYINVLGPNPAADAHDITFPVRRALLLRVHLGARPDESLSIDPGLLAGFLKIDKYRHGARSLEKIAEQVRLASRTGEFTRSDLPSRSQLDLHVDAEQFLNLVERET